MHPLQLTSSSTQGVAVKPARILAVDDEAINRMLLGDMLGEDCTVVPVASGREALDLLARGQFDLVLLDIMMPGLSGFDVLEALRSEPAHAGLPVILISAIDNNESVVRGLSLGANDYISKPFHPGVVKARVETQLALKRLLDERDDAIVELQYVHEMKDHMVRAASHDLRAPLATIRSANYLLQDAIDPDDPEATQLLDAIDSTVDSMYQTIQNYLDVAFEPHGNTSTTQFCDYIEDILVGVTRQQTKVAEENGILFEVTPIDLPFVLPTRRTRQILGHLVRHALQYSVSNASIQLAANELPGGSVRITVTSQVLDIGAANIAASGLGIADHLARLLGGRVGIDHPLDDCLVFWLSIPQRSLRSIDE